MLALSPPLFSTSYAWPLDALLTQNLQQDCNEANSYNTLFDFAPNSQNQHDFAQNSISMSPKEAINGSNDDHMNVVKKLNHNASERDRRKRVNELYAFLRSLLPIATDQTKKVSIPRTVSRALKYIPELQQEVETLKNKREKILSCSLTTNVRNSSAKETKTSRKSSVVSCVSVVGKKEVVIQLISSFDVNKNKEIGLLSKALEYLEEEEDGLVLLSATTRVLGEERLLNTLYFQVLGECIIEADKLKEKLSSLYYRRI